MVLLDFNPTGSPATEGREGSLRLVTLIVWHPGLGVVIVKGILLAGGSGTRLRPVTAVVSKQLLPVYDKPLIYYPLATLMLSGIREVLVISTPRDLPQITALLGDGGQWGISITYAVQGSPDGIAQSLTIGAAFADGEPIGLILGDNIFYGPSLGTSLARNSHPQGVHVLAQEVSDPERYAVLEVDANGEPTEVSEKPEQPRSRLAVTGLYFFASDAPDVAAGIKPSVRGELEITDVNRAYLREGRLTYEVLPRGTAWLDAGTVESLHEASTFVRVVEKRQGVKIACIEEIAWRLGWISDGQLSSLGEVAGSAEYGKYLRALLDQR